MKTCRFSARRRAKVATAPLVGLALFALSVPAQSQDLMSLLERGPVVLVETKKNGRFESATAVIKVSASIDKIWKVVTNFARYKEFVPNMVESTSKVVRPNVVDVTYEIEVPGPNTDYTFRYALDRASYTIKCRWREGDLKGSFCKWRLVALTPQKSLIYYTTASRNFSSLAQSLEDDQQTITIGVNVSAALAGIKAMKRRAEGR